MFIFEPKKNTEQNVHFLKSTKIKYYNQDHQTKWDQH
jgi:hypothetical protein